VLPLNSEPHKAAEQIKSAEADFLIFWDESLGQFDMDWLKSFQASKDDCWHLGQSADPHNLLVYIQPSTYYRHVPDGTIDKHINWRIDLRGAIIRKDIIKKLGGLQPHFDTLAGAAWDMGWRWLINGGVVRQRPGLFPKPYRSLYPTLVDYYRFVANHNSIQATRYIAFRRIFQGYAVFTELRSRYIAVKSVSPQIEVLSQVAPIRDFAHIELRRSQNITVVLPTYGRRQYLMEVLEDLRSQTIKPTQIIIADGNQDIDFEVYEKFNDLPLEIIHLNPEDNGICKSRNLCLQKSSGDYIWFVDDDSRIASDNLENHLSLLEAYDADVSVGPAYTRERPELHGFQRRIACTFMDCGTTLVKWSLLEKVGGFDVQFNEHLAGEDGELGERFIKAGGLMLNNPLAKRFHYLAPIGGSRSSLNSNHLWKRWVLRPRPIQSIYYRSKLHFDSLSARETLFIAWLMIGWKRKDGKNKSTTWFIWNLISEILVMPISIIRLVISVRISQQMLREGAKIPTLERQS
jgi:glycosyltransferase involved in cell wall biosynthesis